MSWDTQLDSILTATEHNMAKIKERLYRKGELSKDQHLDLLYDNIMPYEEAPSKPDVPRASSVTSMSRVGTSEDIVSISSQLLSQAKMITSLHQAISKLERDRDHQQQRIQSLEDEVRQLRALQGDKQDSALERKVEGLRHELSSELRHLQERARDSPGREIISGQRSTASIMQEVNESKRLLWKEYESLRRDTDYLHQRLRRQEDDVLRQFAESQEVKQVQGRNTKMLEGLQSSQQTQTLELNRTKSETREIQRDLLQIRSAIGDLKEEVKTLEEKLYTCSVKNDRKERGKPSTTRKKGTNLLLLLRLRRTQIPRSAWPTLALRIHLTALNVPTHLPWYVPVLTVMVVMELMMVPLATAPVGRSCNFTPVSCKEL
ncbi:myosin-4 [Bombina bombina]|uniref:myosin-4 n=1 Tax=Bombina bombina TaxID=8345 RepID=UPI00235B2302|nr:myosin-4 [Bombina bombina]